MCNNLYIERYVCYIVLPSCGRIPHYYVISILRPLVGAFFVPFFKKAQKKLTLREMTIPSNDVPAAEPSTKKTGEFTRFHKLLISYIDDFFRNPDFKVLFISLRSALIS